jgi:5-methylthioadenosine/S-adenosylhomocysteine deaminase
VHTDGKLLIRDGRFLTMAPGSDPYTGWMLVGGDGRIAALGEGDPGAAVAPEVPVVDVGGAFVAPGFVSAHSHLFTSGSRGLGMDQSLYGWIAAMTRWTNHATSDDLYWLTLHGSLDFLNNGITTAYDFTSARLEFHPETAQHGGYQGELRPAEHAEAQFRGKVDAGIRFVNSVFLDDAVGDAAEVLGRLDEIVGYANDFRDHPGYLRSAISGAVQWAADPASAALEVEAMARHGIMNQPHFLETPEEAAAQQEKFWWYRDAGALGPDLVFGHFIQTTDEIIVEAAAHGCGMVWQPTSNGRLGSGVAAIPRCREVGMRIGMGLDDQACTDISDPFQNLRMGLYLLRATYKDPGIMGVREVLELHTLGSARVLGIDGDVGSLEVGKFADFLVVDPRHPDTGPVWDDVGTYVLACGLRNLRQVWVGGELVADDGRITSPDGEAASEEIHARLARIVAGLA